MSDPEYISDLTARLKWREKTLARAKAVHRKAKADFDRTAKGEDLDSMTNAAGVVKTLQAAIKTETAALNRLKAEHMGETV